ncbi:HIT family protein [Plantactinospora siamensis]|uniref:HIT family protein n=1 Tax=Plantactinospora siamensis TaxID=555372 RepID=A0ABV6NRI3_9ACTN
MPLYHLSNSRSAEQLADMLRLEAAGTCLFCPDELERDAEQQILHRTAHWTVTPNEFPYAGTRLHLLLVPHAHVGDLLDLPAAAQAEFWTVLGWVRDRYGLAYYGLGSRNGDPGRTGGTIEHVHLHVVVGDADDPAHQPVRMKLSQRSDPETEARLRRRLAEVDPDQLDAGRA